MSIHIHRVFWFTIICSIFLTACGTTGKNAPINIEQETINLLKIDNEFAQASMKKGLKNAYLDYIDSNAVLLRPNSLPIVDAEAVDYIVGLSDTAYDISWKPTAAYLSNGADLGYSYGVYEINLHEQGKPVFGTYITVWKKQADGNWKFVLQSNNDGVSVP